MSRSFFDTNVLVYAEDNDAPAKQAVARRLLEEAVQTGDAAISTQVLQEYFVTSTRKLGVDPAVTRRTVELLSSRLHVAVVAIPDILAAIDLHRLHGWSFWDALIVRAAREAGCRVLFTEDLQAGRRFEGLEIVNPFS